ncbi:uncharacterized protein KIAA0895 isoform X6 [Xiphias gladius]|uniref:uncharacterized protein KIAA0895 isoform X6 n=1 Tax=Xiphias gladius TaxID=8245 RepID=UPI001A986803|nr:uncharacterized protein KIAA0895 isoform X6 [Xiphias gladius]
MMLESIQVTERLHWPEVEMSKKYILNSTDKALSPSQVYLEKISSSVLKDLISAGSSSYNILLQAEEEEWDSPKQSLYKRPKTSVKCGATLSKRNHPGMAFKRVRAQEGDGKPSQTNCVLSGTNSSFPKPARNIAVVGSTMGLTPRTVSQFRKMCLPNSPRTKLPSLHKDATTREVENARKLCILTAIKPSNVEKEKAKFLKSDFNYNPQFEYSNPVSPLVLARHNNASDRFLTQAVHIMELALQRYGSYEKFEQVTGGNLLTKSRTLHNVKKYMEKEGCMGEIVVQVTDDLLSRASMTVVNSRPTLTINISTAREHWLEGMLRHEIGCFSKDQVYLDGILKILRYRDKINFPLLMALGKVSFEDVDHLKAMAQVENIRIPHFMQDQVRYAEQLTKIMMVNQLTDEELKTII